MPRGYRWAEQFVSRKNKKGNAMGGMVMEIRNGLLIRELGIDMLEEGMNKCKVKVEKEL